MRRKLAVNAVINPLTALLDCRNGDLFKSEQARELLIQICNEISEVYRTQMVAETQAWLKDLQSHGVDTTNTATPSFPESLTSEALQAEVLRAAAVTRRNISSTLQDIRRGRHTEINFLNGYLVDIGREHGVNTPVNSALTNLVRLKGSLPLNLV
jgi:2-dehydropantoate 2-reductase